MGSRYMPPQRASNLNIFNVLLISVGRHPCAGMKIAQLEIKLILAIILLGYELVDGNGNYIKFKRILE
jgi:cytochrome P450